MFNLFDGERGLISYYEKQKIKEQLLQEQKLLTLSINSIEKKNYGQGISPNALLGAVLYIACKRKKLKRSQLEIAKAVGTSEVTLRNRAKEIISIIDKN